MAGIFISYRRADSDGWAGRLRDALRFRFGDVVFQDVDSIGDGEIFSDVIDRALQECDVALVIIGPHWASARDEQGRRRLDVEDDWVRTETAMVLNRNIRVIPVLVGGAQLPRAEDLPDELRSLTRRQAREIRSSSWDSDVALLANHLKQIVGHRSKRPVWHYAVPAGIAVAGIAVLAAGRFVWESTGSPPTERVAAVLETTETPVKAPLAEPAQPAPAKTARDAKTTEKPRDPPPPAPSQSRAWKLQTPAPAAARVPDKQPEPARVVKPTPAPATAKVDVAPAGPARTQEKPAAVKTPPAPVQTAPAAPAPIRPQDSTVVAMAKPPAARVSAPEAATPRPAVVEAPAAAPRPVQEASKPTAPSAIVEKPPERPAITASVAPKPPAPAARATLNFPNRPATARELTVGDSWTYRLRDMRASRNLATITHEIAGGDASGIRETVRIGERQLLADAAGSGGSPPDTTQRRLALQPRIFELHLDGTITLFEFAPFLIAYSEPLPRTTWTRIPGASAPDALGDWTFNGRVTGTERVRVAAGSFDAIKVELEGKRDVTIPTTIHVFDETFASQQSYLIWFVPEIGRAIKYERRSFNRARRTLEHEQYELVSYQLR